MGSDAPGLGNLGLRSRDRDIGPSVQWTELLVAKAGRYPCSQLEEEHCRGVSSPGKGSGVGSLMMGCVDGVM